MYCLFLLPTGFIPVSQWLISQCQSQFSDRSAAGSPEPSSQQFANISQGLLMASSQQRLGSAAMRDWSP